jgi:hypothetical protein
MFVPFICMHFWVLGIVRRWSACSPTAYEVVSNCLSLRNTGLRNIVAYIIRIRCFERFLRSTSFYSLSFHRRTDTLSPVRAILGGRYEALKSDTICTDLSLVTEPQTQSLTSAVHLYVTFLLPFKSQTFSFFVFLVLFSFYFFSKSLYFRT